MVNRRRLPHVIDHEDLVRQIEDEIALVIGARQAQLHRFELEDQIVSESAIKPEMLVLGAREQMDQRAQVFVDGFVTRAELLEMMRLGAVGELTGWAFDDRGRIIEGGTNARLTSIPPKVPAKALTIGAAVGPAKVSAIRAALKGRLINGLVTDETTASAILKALS